MYLGEAIYDLVNRSIVPRQVAVRIGPLTIPVTELCRQDLELVFVDDSANVVQSIDVDDIDIVDAKEIRDKLRTCVESLVGNRGVSESGAEVVRKALPELISLVRSQRMAQELDQNGHIEIVQEDNNNGKI